MYCNIPLLGITTMESKDLSQLRTQSSVVGLQESKGKTFSSKYWLQIHGRNVSKNEMNK